MPLYEFICAECGTPFEELVMSLSAISKVTCPKCDSPNVRKKISRFASKAAGSSGFSLGSAAASCSTGST